jgi:hypothetical protein
MSRKSRGDILFALALLLMIGGGSAFVWVQTAPLPPRPQPYQGGSQGTSATFSLVPVTIRNATSRPASDIAAARAAWEDFINHVAADEASVRLAGRLYGGMPAEISRIDPAAAQSGAAAYLPPSPGRSVVLRFASLPTGPKGGQPRTPPPLLLPYVSITVTIIVADQAQTIGGIGYAPGSGTVAPLQEVLSILADDYFLRHGLPWMLSYNDANAKSYNDAAAMRAELNKRIQKVADDGEQMYGGLKPK